MKKIQHVYNSPTLVVEKSQKHKSKFGLQNSEQTSFVIFIIIMSSTSSSSIYLFIYYSFIFWD